MTSEHYFQPTSPESQLNNERENRKQLVGVKAILDFYENETEEEKNQRRAQETKRQQDEHDNSALSHVPTYEINGATWAFISMPSRRNRN